MHSITILFTKKAPQKVNKKTGFSYHLHSEYLTLFVNCRNIKT